MVALAAVFSLSLLYFAAETRAQCRHTLVTQKGLRVNTQEEIYVNFHDCEDTVTVFVSLLSLPNKENEHYSATIRNHNHNRRPVKVDLQAESQSIENDHRGNPVFEAELEVKYCFGQDCRGPWTEIPSVKTLLNSTHGYAIMATDRPAYRPGEKVNLMVALTDQDLKPSEERRPLKIFIKTPEEKGKIIVHDSEELFVKPDGFLDYDYQIPSNPMEGIWWAETHVDGIKMAERSFVIDRYKLPTFQVIIKPRYRFVLETMSHLEGTIEAEYSYGEKVNGFYYMTFSLIRDDGSETLFHKIPARFGDEASISRGREEYRVPIARLQRILRDGESIRGLADTDARIVITASVTGLTESVFESDVVEDIIFTKSPFEIDYSQSAKFFIPGTVYALKATIKDAQSHLPLPDVPARVQWGQDMKDVASDDNGEIYLLIDVFQADVETVTVTINSEDFPGAEALQAELRVSKYQPSRTLGLRVRQQVVDVGDQQDVIFDIGDSRPSNIRFFVVARGQFVYADTKELIAGQQEVSSSFLVDSTMVPNARVVAYYILNGELTSNSAWFDVTNECETELVITSTKDEVKPGKQLTINLEGAPHAKVLLMAVDRAAYFVHNGTRVNRQQLWTKMEAYDTGCSRKGGLTATNVFEEAGLSFNSPLTQGRVYTEMYCGNSRRKRNAPQAVEQGADRFIELCGRDGQRADFRDYSCSKRADMIREASKNKKYSVETLDECVRTFKRNCNSRRATSSLGRAAANAQAKAEEVRVHKRENFGESWFFQLRTLNGNGRDEQSTRSQDSITYYEVDAFGMSNDSPMCVAETKNIKVFTNVFIQLYLPYSLKVLEQASIRYSVFNYDDDEQRVDIFIRHSEDLCTTYQAVEGFKFVTSLTVPGKSAQSSTFTVLPLRVPKNPATIEIKASNFDHIQREILIEHEGHRNESSRTIVLEPMEDGAPRERRITFDIPHRSVMPTTKSCSIYAYAHPMGPSVEINPYEKKLQNMDGYIHQPYGCGEQNMIVTGPIVYIHKYRVEVYGDAITAEQRAQVLAHIQSAYTIELKWRSDQVNDRAFAVWNYSPPSTWLNAFVTKVFAAAREFWPGMDVQPFCTALEWLTTERQNEDQGFFREEYDLHHKDMRGLVEDPISLSAYVSISLIEAAPMCPDLSSRLFDSANRAISYLKVQEVNAVRNPYTLAMGAYALATSEPGSSDSEQWNRRLKASQSNDEEYIFWKGNRGRASDIETTAYALLAEITLHGINPDNDKFARNVANWLISQRNAQGGFMSTQDTVVALQALSTYMAVLENSVTVASPPTNLLLHIESNNPDRALENPVEVRLTPDNDNRRMEIDIEGNLLASAGGVSVRVSGVGTGSLAYRCTWRQFTDDGHCGFVVTAEMVIEGEEKILKVAVSKPDTPAAPMSIIDVGILSGFVPDEESIKKLIDVVDPSADRYEITNNAVKFYISGIDSEGVRLAFKINQVAHVGKPQPASVSAYDYYEPETRCTKFYSADGDPKLHTSNCESSDNEMCRCTEGVCPICRTREQQLTDTICSSHENADGDLCEQNGLCVGDDCYNLHRKTCDSAYLYVATVTETGEDESGSMYFLATIEEVIRESVIHVNAETSVVKFMMRKDCFAACKDDARLSDIARAKNRAVKHYISVDRTLMIYGSEPSFDEGENRFVYYLGEGAGMEITISSTKCTDLFTEGLNCRGKPNKKQRKKCKKAKEKFNVCRIKSVLKDAHQFGCD